MDIKATLRRMVARVGKATAASELCAAAGSDMSLWTSDASSRFIPIDHLMLLDADAKVDDLFLKEWAYSRGYNLTPRDIKQSNAPTVIKTIAELSRASGELEYTTLAAAEDHIVTAAERRQIQNCIAPVKDRLAQLESAIS